MSDKLIIEKRNILLVWTQTVNALIKLEGIKGITLVKGTASPYAVLYEDKVNLADLKKRIREVLREVSEVGDGNMGYTVPWALKIVRGQGMFIRADFPLLDEPEGNHQLKVVPVTDGVICTLLDLEYYDTIDTVDNLDYGIPVVTYIIDSNAK